LSWQPDQRISPPRSPSPRRVRDRIKKIGIAIGGTLLVLALAGGVILTPQPPRLPPSSGQGIDLPPPPSSGKGIDLIGHPAHDWSAYTVAIMQPWDFAKQQAALAHGVIPFEYKDLTSTRSNDCGSSVGGGSPCIVNGVICPAGVNDAPNYPTGLGFCWTWRNHPAWFYRHNGLVTENGFPNQYLMDWRRSGYQLAWAAHVVAAAQAHGWRWVWADNALSNPRSYTSFDTYGGASQTQAATTAMLTQVGNYLRKRGIGIIPNLGWMDRYPSLWDSWLPLVSGASNEHSAGNVAHEKASCISRLKVCFFGDASGIDPTFQVIAPR
jgi:hypothetical protein